MITKSNDSRKLQEECRAKIAQLFKGSHIFKGELSTRGEQNLKVVDKDGTCD